MILKYTSFEIDVKSKHSRLSFNLSKSSVFLHDKGVFSYVLFDPVI